MARVAAALWAALAIGLWLVPSPAGAQAPVRKLALVIGNAEYDGNVLDNPEHDATAVSERLKAMGFTVTPGMNLGRAGMGSLIAQFVDQVADGDLVLIFYAGHGVEVAGQTYLIPVDARMLSPNAPRFEGVPVEQLWSFAHRPYGTVILFDACRDSPFLSRVRGDVAGAHAASTPPNTLVLFSSSAGRPASDGAASGSAPGHSLFTTALLDALGAPDTSLDQVVRATTRSVRAVSGDTQIPQRYGGLDQDFAFAAPAAAPRPVVMAAPAPPPPLSAPPAAVTVAATPARAAEPQPQPPVQVAVASVPTTLRSMPAPAAADGAGSPAADAPSTAITVAAAPLMAAGAGRFGGAPPPPVLRGITLEPIADVVVPKSFCSLEEKYAFIQTRQKPAGEAALRNNALVIAYKAELSALYIKYRDATAGGLYSGDVMAELNRVGAIADAAFATAGAMTRLFDVVMAVPVDPKCKG